MTSLKVAPQAEGTFSAPLPRHVAIIMDGNRRWARLRGVVEAEGHAAGVEAIRPIVRRAAERGLEVLSIYAFSRENWQRASDEVRTLFGLLESAIRDETPELVRQGVRVRVLGRLDELPAGMRDSISQALEETAGGDRITGQRRNRSGVIKRSRATCAVGCPPAVSTSRSPA